ncbi:uncharacterized protein [Diabrotica undecimpunctata]|uniref:uncharacterized protein n=1 Tax=Diabrotica undecimpunctata TaxID=50387 RepID=UPI003B631ADC
MKDKNLSRNTKLKINRVVIRPVVTYVAETMCLTEKDEEKLRIFESKILRRIMGPIRMDNGKMRRRMNHELRDIIKGEDIVKFIKTQRLRCLGYIERRKNDLLIKKITRWKPATERPRGRPREMGGSGQERHQNSGSEKLEGTMHISK